MFRDIHEQSNLSRGRVGHINFHEVLYADDTALITNNCHAMNRLLAEIEKQAAYYGLSFNKGKCVALNINGESIPKFADGTNLKLVNSVIYLGASMNNTDTPKQDVNTRIGTCMAVLNRLNFFWKKSNCPCKFKLQVFDAVIRSKLVYSLDAVSLTPGLYTKLNSIQFKGLRKILKLDHTFVNRTNTNAKIRQDANAVMNPQGKPNKNIVSFSEYEQKRQETWLKHLVRAPNDDPLRKCTLKDHDDLPLTPHLRRVGRPKVTWAERIYRRMWTKHSLGTDATFKLDPPGAMQRLGEKARLRII